MSRYVLLATLALLIGAGGGVAGGLVAMRFDGDGVAPAAVATATPEPTRTLDERIRAAVDRVLPAVVTVIADLPDERLDDGRILERRNVGSGVVVSEAGHVLTNFHVVDGAVALTVVLATGEERPAALVSDDSPFTDLAVLIIPAQGLRVSFLGDSDALRPGDTVVAISGGLVSGFQAPANSVSVGVVSGLGRSLARDGVILEDLVQTDAAVNHGDSGGALINLDGEVVGLLTTVIRRTPADQIVEGVALAQSSNSLQSAVTRIILQGFNPRPRLGIERPGRQHIELTPARAEELGLPVPYGTLVVSPEPGSPAAEAGVRAGDIVVELNGVPVDLDNPLPNLLKRLPEGSAVQLRVLRGNQLLVITVSPSEE